MNEKTLLYAGWWLLFITFVLNITLLVCYKEDKTRLEKENNELKLENNTLKNYSWYCEQLTYIIENGGYRNEIKNRVN